MNMSPQQVGEMSMWQFFSMVDGMAERSDGLSAEEEDELRQWMKSKAGT